MMDQPNDGGSIQGGIVTLANAIPSAQSCTVLELIAFPSSLAALKHGIKWNASCWVANQRLNDFEQEQIGLHAYRARQQTPHIEWCLFATDINDTVSMMIVFPELKTSFRSQEIMQRWTDSVVLPAFRTVGIADSTLTSSFKIIQMTAEAEREQTLNGYAPDTILTEILSKNSGLGRQDLQALWTAIQENANKTVFFHGFKNLFLVAIRSYRARSLALPMHTAWKVASNAWDQSIDMAFVPFDSLRANASITINVQSNLDGNAGLGMQSGHNLTSEPRTSADSLWETSRKRRIEDDDEYDKRLKVATADALSTNDTVMQM